MYSAKIKRDNSKNKTQYQHEKCLSTLNFGYEPRILYNYCFNPTSKPRY